MQFRAVRPVVSRPPPDGREADISDASAQRQKLVVFREQWKAKVLAKPEDAAAFARLGEVCAQLDEVDGLFRFGQQLSAQHAEAWRPAAATLKVLAPDRAEDLLLGVLHLPNVDSRGRAEACSQLGQLRPQEAEKWYRQALAWDPDSSAAVRLAETLGESGRLAEAAEMFQVAGMKHELKPHHLFQYGEALVLSEQFDSGRALLRKAAEADLSLAAMAHACMALSYLLQQQISLATDCCHQALQRPTAANTEALHLARFLKSFCHLRNFDVEAALEAVSETLQTCGGENPLRESMEAFKVRLQAMQPKPGQADVIQMADNFDTQTTAAFLHLTLGQWDEAEEVLQNVLQGDGCCPEALLMQAQLLLRQNKFGCAIEYLQKCLRQSFTLLYSRREQVLVHLLSCLCYHRRASGGDASISSVDRSEVRENSPRLSEGSPVAGQWRASLMRFLTGCTDDAADSGYAASNAAREGQEAGPPPGKNDLNTASMHFASAIEVEPQVKDTIAACTDAVNLTLLLRKRSLAIELDAEESGILFQHALNSPASSERGDLFAPPKMPALVGTASTAMPASDNPSRQNSETQLTVVNDSNTPPTMESISRTLSQDRLLNFAELEFGELLSRGEITIVQKAVYRGLPVVVKALHYEGSASGCEAVEDMLAEIKILTKLNHPRLVPLVGACLEATQLALVTRLAPGGNLHHALHVRRHSFSREVCFQLAMDCLEGVRYLHSLQPPVLHLDLKSMNLVLDVDMQHLQICDFGLSRLAGAVRRGLGRGGSPRYMAPECFDEQLGAQTEKTDVWSSACILLEIFGQCQPYAECSNVQQILNMLLVQQLPPPLPDTMEARIKSVIAYALQYEAEARPQIGQLLLQLQHAAEHPQQVSKSRFQWIP